MLIPPATSVAEGNVFRGDRHSVHGEWVGISRPMSFPGTVSSTQGEVSTQGD